MNPWVYHFLLGLMGSATIELVVIVRSFEAGRRMPVRYCRRQYLIPRSLLALVAGVLAAASEPPGAMWAIGIGAATPAIIDGLGKRAAKNSDESAS